MLGEYSAIGILELNCRVIMEHRIFFQSIWTGNLDGRFDGRAI